MSTPLFDSRRAVLLSQKLSAGMASSHQAESTMPPLAELALLCAWKRSERPALPTFADVQPPSNMPRYASGQSRTEFARLIALHRKDSAGSMVVMALKSLQRAGFAVHPFDYARMEQMLERNAEILDEGARQWLRTVRPEKDLPEAIYDLPPINDETVSASSKGQKVAYVKAKRLADPSAGLLLIEKLCRDEPAAIRLELVSVLSERLSQNDVPFLESLAADRAQTVRDAADTLLASVPGTAAHMKRIARLKEEMTIKGEGLLRRRKMLVFNAPGKMSVNEINAAILKLVRGLSLESVAAALGESPGSLISIAASSDKFAPFAHELFLSAALEGRRDILEANRSVLDSGDLMQVTLLLQSAVPHVGEDDLDWLLRFSVKPQDWQVLPYSHTFDALASTIGKPLPPDIARSVLTSKLWDKVEPARIEQCADAACVLVPAELSPMFVSRFENTAPLAAQYHRFLAALSNEAT